jgi:HK97 gp10 family phage protein
MIDVKVEGLSELLKALSELPKELHKGPLRSAVSAAAKVVQDQAKLNAPVDSGVLKRSIYRTRSRQGSSAVQEMAVVGIRHGKKYQKRGQDAWYWRFIEFGIPSRQVAARPFMRQAFDNTKQKQLDMLSERLKKAISRAAAKVRGK